MYCKYLVKLEKLFSLVIGFLKNEITMYPSSVLDFEKKFARYTGRKHAVSFCNGTSTLEAALFALRIREGDEVIIPSYTIYASIFPVLNCGAKPVYADIDPVSLTIDPDDIEKKISSRTKAILPVHIWGNPCNMDRIREIAGKHNLYIIEDCSHSHGARWRGKQTGSLGHIGCFSLQGAKAVAAGEGGIAVCDDQEIYERMLSFGHFTRETEYTASTAMQAVKETGTGFKRRALPLGLRMAAVDLKYLKAKNRMFSVHFKLNSAALGKCGLFDFIKPYVGAEIGGFYRGMPVIIKEEFRQLCSAETMVMIFKKHGIPAAYYGGYTNHLFPYMNDPEYRMDLLYADNDAIPDYSGEDCQPLPQTENIKTRIFHIDLFSAHSPAKINAACKEIKRSGN